MGDVFPNAINRSDDLQTLRGHIEAVCLQRHLIPEPIWVEKLLQVYRIQFIQHGVMLVGPSASGKTCAWQVLLEGMARLDGIEGTPYLIDAKAMSKDQLYGTLDATTREWNDGLFTHILRKIIDSARGENQRRHWIIFDGDVDPEWVENLNRSAEILSCSFSASC